MSTITAELVEKNAKIKIPLDGTTFDALVFDKDDHGDAITLWFTIGAMDGSSEVYRCEPDATFEVVEQAPTSMTLPELVREFTAIRVAIALDQPFEHRRLYIIVDELRSRGGLD